MTLAAPQSVTRTERPDACNRSKIDRPKKPFEPVMRMRFSGSLLSSLTIFKRFIGFNSVGQNVFNSLYHDIFTEMIHYIVVIIFSH